MQNLRSKIITTKQNIINHQSLMNQTINQHHNIIEKCKKTSEKL
jgi:hypothetical protein